MNEVEDEVRGLEERFEFETWGGLLCGTVLYKGMILRVFGGGTRDRGRATRSWRPFCIAVGLWEREVVSQLGNHSRNLL